MSLCLSDFEAVIEMRRSAIDPVLGRRQFTIDERRRSECSRGDVRRRIFNDPVSRLRLMQRMLSDTA